MVGAQHRAQLPHPGGARVDALLVEVVPEHVHPVGAGQVVEAVPVEVGDLHARGGGEEAAGPQVLAYQTAVLEGDPIGGRELEVGDARLHLGGEAGGLGEALAVEGAEAHEPVAPLDGDLLGRVVGAEELPLVVFVERNQGRHPPGDARVPAQRGVLGPGELEPGLELEQPQRRGRGAHPIESYCCVHQLSQSPRSALELDHR
jgi:hypothetical protein